MVQLGNAISQALSVTGLSEERVSRWLGRPCGCRERRERLNRLGRWAVRVLRGRTCRAEQHLERILQDG